MFKFLNSLVNSVTQSNTDKFESIVNSMIDQGLKKEISRLKNEGYTPADVLFAMILRDYFFSLKKAAYEKFPPIRSNLGLTQNEMKQSLEKVFNYRYSELFE